MLCCTGVNDLCRVQMVNIPIDTEVYHNLLRSITAVYDVWSEVNIESNYEKSLHYICFEQYRLK